MRGVKRLIDLNATPEKGIGGNTLQTDYRALYACIYRHVLSGGKMELLDTGDQFKNTVHCTC